MLIRTGQQESVVMKVQKLVFAFYHIINDKTVDVLLQICHSSLVSVFKYDWNKYLNLYVITLKLI